MRLTSGPGPEALEGPPATRSPSTRPSATRAGTSRTSATRWTQGRGGSCARPRSSATGGRSFPATAATRCAARPCSRGSAVRPSARRTAPALSAPAPALGPGPAGPVRCQRSGRAAHRPVCGCGRATGTRPGSAARWRGRLVARVTEQLATDTCRAWPRPQPRARRARGYPPGIGPQGVSGNRRPARSRLVDNSCSLSLSWGFSAAVPGPTVHVGGFSAAGPGPAVHVGGFSATNRQTGRGASRQPSSTACRAPDARMRGRATRPGCPRRAEALV